MRCRRPLQYQHRREILRGIWFADAHPNADTTHSNSITYSYTDTVHGEMHAHAEAAADTSASCDPL
jgi:hypothetical protein